MENENIVVQITALGDSDKQLQNNQSLKRRRFIICTIA